MGRKILTLKKFPELQPFQDEIELRMERYAAKRAQLKQEGDYAALQKLPRNASPVRLHNICKMSGRPKGYMRQFGISRINFREMASNGLIPGVRKASW